MATQVQDLLLAKAAFKVHTDLYHLITISRLSTCLSYASYLWDVDGELTVVSKDLFREYLRFLAMKIVIPEDSMPSIVPSRDIGKLWLCHTFDAEEYQALLEKYPTRLRHNLFAFSDEELYKTNLIETYAWYEKLFDESPLRDDDTCAIWSGDDVRVTDQGPLAGETEQEGPRDHKPWKSESGAANGLLSLAATARDNDPFAPTNVGGSDRSTVSTPMRSAAAGLDSDDGETALSSSGASVKSNDTDNWKGRESLAAAPEWRRGKGAVPPVPSAPRALVRRTRAEVPRWTPD
ncbi:hypothetical protein BDZ91DRAFT_750751, partial [Kalaharituber pfeilii]